ncbi:ABC transporter ATP-binding protein [Clostridium sp. CCUG 7971]|uniref:ABC transporter ATP-binding protein n=1 Tax=Clostridium sp. CCUG 7971 TaxID=2811414 RepID=UPI001ABB9500|nr:ABC transporter ATP-binding protein [Clostridium sp. CCUG 7971]MBO3446002.1 ABC transporter ATP-binding protein [Clostridium sp. CCUG 7971]
MFKVLKYLKPFVLSIITVVALLVVQAVCDLSLPDYTSKIVNVGIQQNGIENAVPKEIRKSELNKLMIFMTDSEKSKIEKNYVLSQDDKAIYDLNTKDKETIDELNSIISKSIMTVSALDMANKEGKIPNVPKGTDIWTIIPKMPQNQINEMKKGIDEKLENLDENMLTQSSIYYVKSEYEKIGIDTEKLQTNYILTSGAKMLGIALISMAATVTVGFLAARVAAGMGKNLRKDVFRKVVGFSNTEFDKFSTASLITRSTNDIQQIQTFMVLLVRMVFYAPILGIGGVIKILNTDTSMAWIIGVAVVAILSFVSVLFALAIPRFKIVQKLVDKLNLVTRESLTGMLVIRAFGTQKTEEKRFDETNEMLRKTNTFVNRIMALMMPTMMLIMNVITVIIVWSGAHQIDAGNMQVGDMMAFIQYAMQIIMSFLMLTMLSVILPRASVSAGRIGEVLETNVVIDDPKNPKGFNKEEYGNVEFKNVSFKYPDAEHNVLTNINFMAKPGETTAFIGSTGSGKSTLINLIPRFFDTSEGEVLVNGVNVKDINQHELRDEIGYVPQKGVLFSGTIESNIKYGVENLSQDELEKAADIAQAMEFIDNKPDKFQTEISQGGTNVSGGQKQRLSIARALAKNPKILIFDDSFSALDLKTDAALRKKLKEEIHNSTMLIVAQRVSTIMNADQIIVLDEGNMVGIGTHEELMKNCEVYNQIAESQLSKEEL